MKVWLVMAGKNIKKITLLNIHWGFSIGGVGKYVATIDNVGDYAPIASDSLCILCEDWHCDRQTLSELRAQEVVIKSRFDISWLWRVATEIDRIKPDVIMTHGFNGHFVSIMTGLLCSHKPVKICSYHGLYHAPTKARTFIQPVLNFITEYYIRSVVQSAVSVAHYSREYLLGRGINKDKVTVVHNGIDFLDEPPAGRRDSLRAEWGVAEGEVLLGIASRIDPVKGLDYLVDAVIELLKDGVNLKLVVIGTGTLEQELKTKAINSGCADSIIFTGFRNDIANCLAAFDLFMLPSLAEYHSIALLEAMRAKKAIIATDVGGNTESVRHEQEALIVRPANVGDLANAIRQLVANPQQAEQLAAAARARFEQEFTTEKMVKSTAQWVMQSLASS